MVNFVYFRLIYAWLNHQIDVEGQQLMANFMAWTGAIALTLVTLWILIQGYRLVTGQSREPMMAFAMRVALIVSVASSMAIFGTGLRTLLTDDLDQEINAQFNGPGADSTAETIDRNLAYLEIAESVLEAVQIPPGDLADLNSQQTALAFVDFGTAGAPMAAGSLLLMFQFSMALFIGFGPLFILCLIFERTRDLFRLWLLCGIGTLFAKATLGVASAMALNATLRVAMGMWGAQTLQTMTGTNSEGLVVMSMEQGVLGLLMTTLIVSAPFMAARFFTKTVGNFMPFSAFGGARGHGGQPGHAGSQTPPAPTQTPAATPIFQHRLPTAPPSADAVRPYPGGAGASSAPTDAQLATAVSTDPAYLTASVGAPAPGTGVAMPAATTIHLADGKAYTLPGAVLSNAQQLSRELSKPMTDAASLSRDAYGYTNDKLSTVYADLMSNPGLSFRDKWDISQQLPGTLVTALTTYAGFSVAQGELTTLTALNARLQRGNNLFDPGSTLVVNDYQSAGGRAAAFGQPA